MKKVLDAHPKWVYAITTLLFLLTVGLACYYIFGAANSVITSDSADTLLWAQASYEAKGLVNPDFYYATLLPLGAHLLMVPWIAIFGLSVTAQTLGMFCFFVILLCSMLFCFRSFGWKYSRVFLSSAFMVILTLASAMNRAMFYGHILYYSQGLLYVFVGLGLLQRLQHAYAKAKRRAAIFLLTLLALWMVLTAVNGEMTLAIFTVPLLGAYALERMLDRKPLSDQTSDHRSIAVVWLLLFLCVMLGLLIRSFLTHGMKTAYANGITSFADQNQWQQHIGMLLMFWMQLVAQQLVEPNILSVAGIVNVIELAAGLTLVAVPIVALLRYRDLTKRWERQLLLLHWVTVAVILFLYVFARYGEADWRLLPILLTSALTTLMYLWHTMQNATLPWKRISGLIAVLLTVYSLSTGYFIVRLPSDYSTANAYGLISFLEDSNLDYGYATYWNAIGPTVYAGEKVCIRQISIEGNQIVPQRYQSNLNWYNQPLKKCFLLLTAQEVDDFSYAIPPDYTEVLSYGADSVYVYDHNIITE